MKKILCPIDFSDNSLEAATFAIRYAQLVDCKLKFFHVPSIMVTTGTVDVDFSSQVLETKQQELEKQINDLYENAGLRKDAHVVCEINDNISIARGIIDEAEKFQSDLIIMGTTGASGIKRLLVGSVTTSVLDHVKCAVLAVPHEFFGREIKKIGMPTDVVNAENEILSAVEFAQIFDAELNLFHISVRQPDHEEFENKMKFMTGYSNITFTEIHPNYEGDIVGGLNDYVEREKPDMLIMNHKRRGWLSELLDNSKTKDMIFQSRTAVLTFNRE